MNKQQQQTAVTGESNVSRVRRPSRKRRSIIISELCKLSRNGWANAKPYDYEPLERELKA